MKLQEETIDEFVAPLGKTSSDFRRSCSKGKFSYAINCPKNDIESIRDGIKGLFSITNSLFNDAFNQAISGNGEELKKICKLHSSSLLPLLCFYGVCQSNPLSLTLVIEGKSIDLQFTQVFFEVKNKVVGFPSNVDIVLWDSEKKVLLFLESKFTEPIDSQYFPARDGKEYYQKWLKYVGFTVNDDLSYSSDKYGPSDSLYYGGIKQMIAHLIGLSKGPYEDKKAKGTKREEYPSIFLNQAEQIILGTILFNGGSTFYTPSESVLLERYIKLYKDCMSTLADKAKTIGPKSVTLLTTPYTYQDLFNGNFELDKKVRDFYRLK